MFNKGRLLISCRMINTAVELIVARLEVADKTTRRIAKTELFMYERLVRGQEKGELSSTLNLKSLAQFIHNSFIGIRVLAKTTDDQQKLENVIDLTLSVLD